MTDCQIREADYIVLLAVNEEARRVELCWCILTSASYLATFRNGTQHWLRYLWRGACLIRIYEPNKRLDPFFKLGPFEQLEQLGQLVADYRAFCQRWGSVGATFWTSAGSFSGRFHR